MSPRRILPLLLAVLLVAPGPAYAAGWAGTDARGDVVAETIDPGSCAPTRTARPGDAHDDVVALGAELGRQRLRVVIEVRDLRARLRSWAGVTVRTPAGEFRAVVDRRRDGRVRAWLGEIDRTVPPTSCDGWPADRVSCPGLRGDVSARRDRIGVVVPRRCLGGAPWVRVGAQVARSVGVTSYVDRTALSPRIAAERR